MKGESFLNFIVTKASHPSICHLKACTNVDKSFETNLRYTYENASYNQFCKKYTLGVISKHCAMTNTRMSNGTDTHEWRHFDLIVRCLYWTILFVPPVIKDYVCIRLIQTKRWTNQWYRVSNTIMVQGLFYLLNIPSLQQRNTTNSVK